MRYPEVLKIIEDKLRIKSTQIRKRRIKDHEINKFFQEENDRIQKSLSEFEEKIDTIIKDYLNED